MKQGVDEDIYMMIQEACEQVKDSERLSNQLPVQVKAVLCAGKRKCHVSNARWFSSSEDNQAEIHVPEQEAARCAKQAARTQGSSEGAAPAGALPCSETPLSRCFSPPCGAFVAFCQQHGSEAFMPPAHSMWYHNAMVLFMPRFAAYGCRQRADEPFRKIRHPSPSTGGVARRRGVR